MKKSLSDNYEVVEEDGFELLELEQGSLEWHMLRSEKYPASEAGAVMEVNPWKPRNQPELAALRDGTLVIVDSMPMQRGRKYEAEAREWVEDALGVTAPAVVAIRGDYMASLDGLTVKENFIIELKVPMNPEKLFGLMAETESLPDHYFFQICQQAWCVPTAHQLVFAVYDPKTATGRMKVYETQTLKEVFEERIRPAWERFASTQHPPIEIDQSENKEWCEAAKRWDECKAALIEAKKSIKLAELEKQEKAAKEALIKACEAGVPNVAHGIRVGWTEVPPKESNGYVMKRVTGSWED